MKTLSAKAKGRRLQRYVRDKLLNISKELFETTNNNNCLLTEDDIRSTGMGQSGEDIQVSSKARELFPFNWECKNVEKLNIWSALKQAKIESEKHNTIPAVVFKRNRTKTYIAIEFDDFLKIAYQYSLKNRI